MGTPFVNEKTRNSVPIVKCVVKVSILICLFLKNQRKGQKIFKSDVGCEFCNRVFKKILNYHIQFTFSIYKLSNQEVIQ